MKDLLCSVYMVKTTEGYRVFLTHDPGIDAAVLFGNGSGEIDLLTPFVPIGIADYVLKTLFTAEEIRGCAVNSGRPGSFLTRWLPGRIPYDDLVQLKADLAFKLLRQAAKVLGMSGTLLPGEGAYPRRLRWQGSGFHQRAPALLRDLNPPLQGDILHALRGKILFPGELEKCLAAGGRETGDNLMDRLHLLALAGKIELLPSLGLTVSGEAVCNRCGLKERTGGFHTRQWAGRRLIYRDNCRICGYPSLYCERCSTLGEARLCRPLYALDGTGGSREEVPAVRINPGGVPPLTPAQSRASRELADFVRDGGKRETLLWAVTGAGKTEVVMEAMTSVLRDGGRVLYASPRRDVIREVAPRFRAALTGVEMIADFGGSAEKFRHAPLVMATAHQTLRYYRNFDLVILDEVDAYPYKGSRMLQEAVQRAARPDGRTVYLTATPAADMLNEAVKGKMGLITIPARHHGYPVPEPRLKIPASFKKDKAGVWTVAPDIPALLYKWCFKERRQVFVFLPTVRMVTDYGPVLEKALSELVGSNIRNIVCFSHSADPERDRKIREFRAGKCRIFVTTTIMERGITVKGANVLVLEADFEKVFDEGSLVQMAGRAGRSAQCPAGEVVFAAARVSGAMKKACGQIRYLNNIARRQGYLVSEGD